MNWTRDTLLIGFYVLVFHSLHFHFLDMRDGRGCAANSQNFALNQTDSYYLIRSGVVARIKQGATKLLILLYDLLVIGDF